MEAGGGVGSNPGRPFFTAAKRWDSMFLACVSVLFPGIEPVRKPYREVCLQTLL